MQTLRGHRDEIISIQPPLQSCSVPLISASADSTIRVWDYPRQHKAASCIIIPTSRQPEKLNQINRKPRAPVNAIRCHETNSNRVFAAIEDVVYEVDLRMCTDNVLVQKIVASFPLSLNRGRTHTSHVSSSSTLTLTKPNTFDDTVDEINAIDVSPQGDFLGACDDTGSVFVLDIQTSFRRPELVSWKNMRTSHANIATSIHFHPSNRWQLATSGLDCSVIAWDYSRARHIKVINTGDLNPTDGMTQSWNPPMAHHVEYIDKQSQAVVALASGDVLLVDLSKASGKNSETSPTIIKTFTEGHLAEAVQVRSISPERILSASVDKKIICWDVETAAVQSTYLHGSKINCLAVCPQPSSGTDSRSIFIGDQTSNISVIELERFR